jgi:hypothetical protein
MDTGFAVIDKMWNSDMWIVALKVKHRSRTIKAKYVIYTVDCRQIMLLCINVVWISGH